MFVDGTVPDTAYMTPADQAEWECFTHELALGCVEHHAHCPGCRLRFPCSRLMKGFAIAEDWLTARLRRSKAEYLRAQLEQVAA